MKKNCAITGTTGYVGGCIKQYFISAGWNVIDLNRTTNNVTNELKFELGSKFKFDNKIKIDALIHCSFNFQDTVTSEHDNVNISGSNILFAAAKEAGINKIVYISSIAAFDSCKSEYGKIKQIIETNAIAYNCLIIRPGLIYGSTTGGMYKKLEDFVKNNYFIPYIYSVNSKFYMLNILVLCKFCESYCNDEVSIEENIITLADIKTLTLKDIITNISIHHRKNIFLIPIYWRIIYATLLVAEFLNLPIGFKTDNLLSYIYQNQNVDLYNGNNSCNKQCSNIKTIS